MVGEDIVVAEEVEKKRVVGRERLRRRMRRRWVGVGREGKGKGGRRIVVCVQFRGWMGRKGQ